MTKSGFTLLEVVVALAIVALIAGLVVPRLAPRKPKQEREQFVAALNALTKFAWQRAVSKNKIQRIEFFFDRREIRLLKDLEKKDAKGEPMFGPIKDAYRSTTMKIPKQYQFKNFYIEGVDEMARHGAGQDVKGAWFYILPDGLAQSVLINFFDVNDLRAGKPRPVGLVLNPFSAQFKVYSAFQTPQK